MPGGQLLKPNAQFSFNDFHLLTHFLPVKSCMLAELDSAKLA
jgi:hypothetical protein